MSVVRARPSEWLVSVALPAELPGRRVAGSRYPARTCCGARPLPLGDCATCDLVLVRTRCRRDGPVLRGRCASAWQTDRTPVDCGSHVSGARSEHLRVQPNGLPASVNQVVSAVLQVRSPFLLAVVMRSSSRAPRLRCTEVEVLKGPTDRALSGTKREEEVCSVAVSLSQSDYPQ